VYALLLAAALPGQFVDDATFARPVQKAAVEATVRVVHPASRGDGSGVAVGQQGPFLYVLTAAHIVPPGSNADTVEITFFDADTWPRPRGPAVQGEVKERMPGVDLAVIQLVVKNPPPVARICPRDKLPKVLNFPFPVLAVGCNAQGAPEVWADRVADKRLITKPDGSRAIYWEAGRAPHVGRSGGPLVDDRGLVLGICSGTQNQKGYYTYIHEVHHALEAKGFKFLCR
jgi:hypothetical protein